MSWLLVQTQDPCYRARPGRVAEWFKAAVLKTAVGGSLPWVRIPPRPPSQLECQARSTPSNRVTQFSVSGQSKLYHNDSPQRLKVEPSYTV